MRLAVLLTVLAACGRFGFDQTSDGGAGDASELITARDLTVPVATTSSTMFTPIPGATLTVPPSPGTRWLLVVAASLESSSLDEDGPEARYLIDGVERGMGGTESVVAGRPGPWQHLDVIDGTTSPITIAFELRDALAATTTLRDLRAAVVPLPDADVQYATADAITPVTATAYSTLHTLTLSPQSAGDYLVLLLVNANEDPGSSDIHVRWMLGGAPASDEYQVPRGAWQSILTTRRLALAPGAATFALQAQTNVAASVQYARAFAIRIDALGDRFAYLESQTIASASSTTPLYTTELMPALGAAPHYLTLATIRVDDNVCGGTIAERGVHFAVDADRPMTIHRPGNCAYETTYGLVRLLPTAPAYVAAGISAQNGVDVQHDESGLLVLGVD